jgi:hypothetical protein
MKVAIRQGENGNGDPILYVSITDHPAYLKHCFVCSTVEEAMVKIKVWLERKTAKS